VADQSWSTESGCRPFSYHSVRTIWLKCYIEGQWRRNEFGSGRKFLCPSTFLAIQVQCTISRFGERFHNGQYSLVSFLFAVLLLMVPPCPAICKSGWGHVLPVPHGVGAGHEGCFDQSVGTSTHSRPTCGAAFPEDYPLTDRQAEWLGWIRVGHGLEPSKDCIGLVWIGSGFSGRGLTLWIVLDRVGWWYRRDPGFLNSNHCSTADAVSFDYDLWTCSYSGFTKINVKNYSLYTC